MFYPLGFYWLNERFHSDRGRLFWEGVDKKKYHMVKWGALAKPKEFGGLGFINTRAMNAALLCKWIFRLDSGDDSIV